MRRKNFLGNAACQSVKSARSSQASKSVTIGCLQCLPVLMPSYRISTWTVQSRNVSGSLIWLTNLSKKYCEIWSGHVKVPRRRSKKVATLAERPFRKLWDKRTVEVDVLASQVNIIILVNAAQSLTINFLEERHECIIFFDGKVCTKYYCFWQKS